MKKLIILLINIITLLLISSCNIFKSVDNKTDATMPGIDIALDDYNKSISIIPYPGNENSNRNDDYMALLVINSSNENYVFPYDYGIKIFIKNHTGWNPVENRLHYGDSDLKFLLVPQKQYAAGLDIALVPYIRDLEKSTTIRVIVVGHLEDDPNKLVGAYIDVPLNP